MNEIIKRIEKLAGKYNEREVFKDFVSMTSITLSNAVCMDEERENEFLRTRDKYTDKEYELIKEMYGLLVLELEQQPRDVLGEIFEKMKLGNSKDQFFTPLNIARMMDVMVEGIPEKEKYTVNDPSCGSGVMIIAKALNLYDMGINYQERMTAVASDIDKTVLLMCYIQLNLLGISAVCEVKDTLNDELYETWYTMMYYKQMAN